MPRTALTVQSTSRDGLTATYSAGDATNDHEFDNSGQNVVLHVKNGGGSGITVTIVTPGTVDGLAIADKAVSVGAGVEMFIGPFNNSQYGSGTNSRSVYFDLDTDTSVTLAALKLGSV